VSQDLAARIAAYGVPFVFANILVEQLGLPVPAYPALVVAGALAADGRIALSLLVLAVLAAALSADSLWYVLGKKHGAFFLKLVCKLSLNPDTCVRQTEGVFEKWGARAMLVSKFIPGFSMVAPPLAGSLAIPYPRFLLFDAVGTLLWGGVAVVLGFVFHGAVDRVLGQLQALGMRSLLVVGGGLALFILLKWVQRRRFYRFLRMSRITAHELREMMKGGESPLVFDARGTRTRELDPRRIPGALVIEMPDLDRLVAGLPRDGAIVLYCT
jgi:membrane protein DedA with SNARE-associated domain